MLFFLTSTFKERMERYQWCIPRCRVASSTVIRTTSSRASVYPAAAESLSTPPSWLYSCRFWTHASFSTFSDTSAIARAPSLLQTRQALKEEGEAGKKKEKEKKKPIYYQTTIQSVSVSSGKEKGKEKEKQGEKKRKKRKQSGVEYRLECKTCVFPEDAWGKAQSHLPTYYRHRENILWIKKKEKRKKSPPTNLSSTFSLIASSAFAYVHTFILVGAEMK